MTRTEEVIKNLHGAMKYPHTEELEYILRDISITLAMMYDLMKEKESNEGLRE